MDIIENPDEELEVDPKKLELKNLPESTRDETIPRLKKRCQMVFFNFFIIHSFWRESSLILN